MRVLGLGLCGRGLKVRCVVMVRGKIPQLPTPKLFCTFFDNNKLLFGIRTVNAYVITEVSVIVDSDQVGLGLDILCISLLL